jgi:LysM domain
VADDRETLPTPRPRRRRTDIDPNAPSPPVANDRRRRHGDDGAIVPPATPVGERHDAAALAATAALTARATSDVASASTVRFHLPGVDPATGAAAADPAEPGVAATATAVHDRPSGDAGSTDPRTCPFLRSIGPYGLAGPIGVPDASNRCAALDVVPQSLRQQELVCLTAAHVDCPRYVRGSANVEEAPIPVVSAGRSIPTARAAALVALVFAITMSAGYAFANGGISFGTKSSAPPLASAPAVAEVSPSIAPAASRLPTPSPTAATSPTATPTVAPTPTPTAAPTPTPRPKPTPTPRSDRFKLLTACAGTARCWVYRVRSGDNLFSIAHYFGVSVDSIYARNPWLRGTGLRAGQQLRLPPPTR